MGRGRIQQQQSFAKSFITKKPNSTSVLEEQWTIFLTYEDICDNGSNNATTNIIVVLR